MVWRGRGNVQGRREDKGHPDSLFVQLPSAHSEERSGRDARDGIQSWEEPEDWMVSGTAFPYSPLSSCIAGPRYLTYK